MATDCRAPDIRQVNAACKQHLLSRTVWVRMGRTTHALKAGNIVGRFVELHLFGRYMATRRIEDVFLSDPASGDAMSVASFIASYQEDCSMDPKELDRLVQMSNPGDYIGIPPLEIITIKPTQEVVMSSTKIEHITRVGGTELATASEDRLINMIKQLQDQKKSVSDLGIRGEFTNKKLTEINEALAEVTAELNRRAGEPSATVEA